MTMKYMVCGVLALGFGLVAAPSIQAGVGSDPVKGKAVYARCAICHSLNVGESKIGPSLNGVFGRAAGSLSGFAYSPALKKSGIVWDVKALDHFLTSPAKAVPGTKMMISVPNAQERADLIMYLKSAAK